MMPSRPTTCEPHAAKFSMSQLSSSRKPARVQRLATLWTHDENFSRDDVVFNVSKFPELTIPPSHLLQIVALGQDAFTDKTQTAQRSYDTIVKDMNLQNPVAIGSRESQPEPTTITFDERGVKVPNPGRLTCGRPYIFVAKEVPIDVRAKHPTLQISVSETIARAFGFRTRSQVMISEAQVEKYEAHHVELTFRDEYLARADMWRIAVSELSGRTIYRGQRLLFLGTIKAVVKQIYINGSPASSGYCSPRTKPIFRSESARYILFIQMSKEMWNFDAEGAGEIMFNRVVGGFLPELFKKWLKINAKHLVTIILFTRMQYDSESEADRSGRYSQADAFSPLSRCRDYYRVVVSDMASGDWINILFQLKREFRTFLREVSTVDPLHPDIKEDLSEVQQNSGTDTSVAGKPSSASQGNILEAINLAAVQFSNDYVDRDLTRTGISVIVVTPGTGVFEVDYDMLKLTTDTLIASGIGIDLVCLSPIPLHSVPLFRYRHPPILSALTRTHNAPHTNTTVGFDLQNEKTPRQHHSVFSSVDPLVPVSVNPNSALDTESHAPVTVDIDTSKNWKCAMPFWVDVSFWSGRRDEVLGQLRTPRSNTVVGGKYSNSTRMFNLRCRLYELQMMGVLESELGSISLPLLGEQPHSRAAANSTLPFPHSYAENSGKVRDCVKESYSTIVGQRTREISVDAYRRAINRNMDQYDSEIFKPDHLSQIPSSQWQTKVQQDVSHTIPFSSSTMAMHMTKVFENESYLSNQATSLHTTFNPRSTIREKQVAKEFNESETNDIHQSDKMVRGNPHPRTSQQHRVSTIEKSERYYTDRSGYGETTVKYSHKDQLQSARSRTVPKTPHVPASSRESSTEAALISNNSVTTRMQVPNPYDRPSNWFLRQISFGGKTGGSKPSTGDATIDISQGKVKPAMLTIEKNQPGIIAKRLASTRLPVAEKPSQPITIPPKSRPPTSTENLSSKQTEDATRTIQGSHALKTPISSQPGSFIKNPGSTFLLAGSRAPTDLMGAKAILSSSGGASNHPRTLSPSSAIAPWAILVNPCNPRKNELNPQNQFRRWHHVLPKKLKAETVRWRSLCSPAAVPLTHDWFPSTEQLKSEYNESPYTIIQNDDDEGVETHRQREPLIKEMISFRLSHGFQIIVGKAVAEFSGKQEDKLASIMASEYMCSEGDTVFMSAGNSIHQLIFAAPGEVSVKRYTRRPITALESPMGVDQALLYKPRIRTAFEKEYTTREITFRPPYKEQNWNIIDTFLAGHRDELSETLRFWRSRYVLIPVAISSANRRMLAPSANDSEEEIRLEGIRTLTQLWQKNRHISTEERMVQTDSKKAKQDLIPFAIEYYTRDPSAIVAGCPENLLFDDVRCIAPTFVSFESEQFTSSSIDIKKLAEDLQSSRGIPMLDRRWHWRLHYNCFVGSDLVNWLLANFEDITTRDEAIELGNKIMSKGLFQHVQRRHHFRDGNFFFQISAEYRAPRLETRVGWFGMRRSEKSVPSTPAIDGPHASPFAPKDPIPRPGTAGSSSSASTTSKQCERTLAGGGSQRRQIIMSEVMRYDVDTRKRSYRPEVIALHYDRLHNPDNCYHIRIDWMNVTAKLIEDAIVSWATSVEKFGLKLVELPIAEASRIVEQDPFRSPYVVKLATQPPKTPLQSGWEYGHSSTQPSKVEQQAYHKALLRKLGFVLDMEAVSAFPAEVDILYSWGRANYRYTQFIHQTGTLLAQIMDDGNLLLLANRLAHSRASDSNKFRTANPYEHRRPTTEGLQNSREGHTPNDRAHGLRSPFASPLAQPVQDSGLLHDVAQDNHATLAPPAVHAAQTPEEVKDEVEAFCSDATRLNAFFHEAFRQAPSPSPSLSAVRDEGIPSLSIHEASPASGGWTLSSPPANGAEMHGEGGRHQGSEGNTSAATLGRNRVKARGGTVGGGGSGPE